MRLVFSLSFAFVLALLVPQPAEHANAASTAIEASGANPTVTKLCIIGNSHVTALRMAVKRGLFIDPRLDLAFWAFPGKHYSDLKFDNGHFAYPNKSTDSGGSKFIDRAQFDVLAFVGPGFRPGLIMTRLKRKNELNPDAIERYVQKLIRTTPELQLMTSAARGYSGKVYFVPWPLISEASGRRQDLVISIDEMDQFNRIASKVFSEVGITYVPQPQQTVRDNKWTKQEYSGGRDSIHMNPRYGNVVLNALRDQLGAAHSR
jgi:hypothetical protein